VEKSILPCRQSSFDHRRSTTLRRQVQKLVVVGDFFDCKAERAELDREIFPDQLDAAERRLADSEACAKRDRLNCGESHTATRGPIATRSTCLQKETRRAAVRELLQLSDEGLHDIGISRDEIEYLARGQS
jgi:uncharacterized protein YjiS (DUF1127 family)